jgi:hypothetical protein
MRLRNPERIAVRRTFAVLALAQLADLATTGYAMTRGQTETGWLGRLAYAFGGFPGLVLLKIEGLIILVFLMVILPKPPMRYLIIVGSFLTALVAITNLSAGIQS